MKEVLDLLTKAREHPQYKHDSGYQGRVMHAAEFIRLNQPEKAMQELKWADEHLLSEELYKMLADRRVLAAVGSGEWRDLIKSVEICDYDYPTRRLCELRLPKEE